MDKGDDCNAITIQGDQEYQIQGDLHSIKLHIFFQYIHTMTSTAKTNSNIIK
jgi:hypothetical protein